MQSPSKRNKVPGPEEMLKLLSAAGLKERVLFTIAMIALYRIGVHIPIAGVDPTAFTKHPELGQNLMGMLDLFSGGALNKLSIFSLGIGPFITASIIMQLLTVAIPKLEELQKNSGEQGRKQLQQYTRMGTIVLGIIQSITLVKAFSTIHNPDVILTPGPLFLVNAVIVLTASAVFVMWMGEQITERGVGNGASLLIFIGIASRLPVMAHNTYEAVQTGQTPMWGVALMIAVFIGLAALIVALQEGMRKILVLGARRNVGRQQYAESPTDYIYLPVNPSGVMAIIFASSLLIFPSTIMQFLGRSDPAKYISTIFSNIPFIKTTLGTITNHKFMQNVGNFLSSETANILSYYHWEHSLLYFALIILFAYFYASIILQPRDIAENLRRSGRAIQGVRPGRPTAEFLERTINRLVFIGATAVGIIAILPIHIEQLTYVQTLQGLGSTSLIILVGVAIDTLRQLITHALSASYQARGLFKPKDNKNI